MKLPSPTIYSSVALLILLCTIASPAHAYSDNQASFRVLKCAVANLPDDQEYPEHEISNKKQDRVRGALKMGAGVCGIWGGVTGRSGSFIGGGVALFLEGLSQADDAHRDVNKMERHNSEAQARREARRDSRYTE